MTAVLDQAARELTERHGQSAVTVMQERIAKFEAEGQWGAVDQASQLLTAVERLLDEGHQ